SAGNAARGQYASFENTWQRERKPRNHRTRARNQRRARKNPRAGAEYRMSQPEPLVPIVCGPSGSGKSTLVQKILELPDTMLAVSSTTRPPRRTESAGKWYNFVSEAQFQGMVARGEFLEYAQVFGKNWYGTPRTALDEALANKKDLV